MNKINYEIIAVFFLLQATEAQKSEFKKAFSKFDKNGDGHISSSELTEVMKGLSVSMTDQQVQDMLKEVDSDNSGSIEFDEFCSYMVKKLNKAKQPPNPEEIRKRAFAVSGLLYFYIEHYTPTIHIKGMTELF